MNPTFVVDCSVLMAWCFEDESCPAADAVLDRLEMETGVVPGLCRLETLNVLLMAERKRRIARAQTERLLAFLSELPIATDAELLPVSVLDIARSAGITAYAAAYLELALRLGLPLATLDRQMHRAAKALGVPLLIKA